MAKYNLQDPRDYLEAFKVIEHAKENGYELEIGRPKKPRTTKQNAYYWLIIEYFACQYGCTKTEAAEHFFKEECNPDIFVRESTDRNGKTFTYILSTTDVDRATMSSAIRNFLAWSDMKGIPLPDEDDDVARKYCEREVEKHRNYL